MERENNFCFSLSLPTYLYCVQIECFAYHSVGTPYLLGGWKCWLLMKCGSRIGWCLWSLELEWLIYVLIYNVIFIGPSKYQDVIGYRALCMQPSVLRIGDCMHKGANPNFPILFIENWGVFAFCYFNSVQYLYVFCFIFLRVLNLAQSLLCYNHNIL